MKTTTSLKLALSTTFAASIALSATSAFAENPFSATTAAPTTTAPAAPTTAPATAAPATAAPATAAPATAAPATAAPAKMGEMKCGGMMMNAAGDGSIPADTNKDGKVTKEEFMKFHETMFDTADTNKDGALDATERQAMYANMGGGKMGGEMKCGGMMKMAPKTETPATEKTETDKK